MIWKIHTKFLLSAALVTLTVFPNPKTILAEQLDCYYCGCNQVSYWTLADCLQECEAGLDCFSKYCIPVSMAGDRPWSPFSIQYQNDLFGLDRLGCYSITGDRDSSYNCIASTIGVDYAWIWSDVDLYGDKDGIVEVDDFDAFYAGGGYYESDSCAGAGGVYKIALYGNRQADGSWEPTHAARQVEQAIGGPWWETKEGHGKKIIHKLDDITNYYGEVIKCYERPITD